MFNFWNPEWYVNKSQEFLEERYECKTQATAFIIFSTVFFVVSLTRWIIGRPLDLFLLVIATGMIVVGCVWFRIAYLSQEELKARLLLEREEREEYACLDCRERAECAKLLK